MKKNFLIKGMAALAVLVLASCSHEEGMSYEEYQLAQYNANFVKKFGNIDPNHDWGFGDGTRAVATRAAETWDGTHTCLETKWEDKLKDIKLPDDAFQLDKEGNYYYNQYAWPEPANVCKIPNNVTVMYLSEDFDDVLRMQDNMPAGAVLYNYGTVKGFSGNFNGTITIYNLGTMTYNPGSQDHNIINTGTLYVKDNDACAKILKLYNGGHIEFDGSPAQLHSKSTYYSNGEGTIDMPYGGVIESACDIHGTINVTGNLNIQTGSTKKICGIVATGRVQNTAGKLEVSYIDADDIYFEGNNIYLTPGAHLKANTMEFDKAACDVNAAAGSNALVEVTENIHFMNDNDFNRTFSDNIYFKIDGSIDMVGQTNGGFTGADRILYNSAADYIAKHGNVNNRLNAGTATGSPACGKPWSVGDEQTITYAKRIICEDLGDTDDFDFNDVVFDALIKDGKTYIKLLAAGGTLPLYIGDQEVHDKFKVPVSTMVNTGIYSADSVEFVLNQAYDSYDKIPVYVESLASGVLTSQMLENKIGAAPKKICVDTDYDWTTERQQIDEKYPDFKKYVGNYSLGTSWYKQE